MIFVERLGKQTFNGRTDEFWLWCDGALTCYCNKMELSILFQKRVSKDIAELMNFCAARDMWKCFKVAANSYAIVIMEV